MKKTPAIGAEIHNDYEKEKEEAMKGNMKCAVLAVLLAVCMAAFAGEALAKPEWLGVKISSWSLKPGGVTKYGNREYTLRVTVKHTNNSRNRVITNIYDKTGRFTIKKPFVYRNTRTTAFTVLSLNSNKNSRVNLTPGESASTTFTWSIQKLDNGLEGVPWTWAEAYRLLGSRGWKLSWRYDCAVRSKRER